MFDSACQFLRLNGVMRPDKLVEGWLGAGKADGI